MANGLAQRTPASRSPRIGLGDPRFELLRRMGEQAGPQFRALGSGLVDSVSMGLADPLIAGFRSLGPGSGADVRKRYEANIRAERARDAFDREHYALARGAGQVAGTVGAVLGMEVMAPIKAVQVGVRLGQGAGHVARVGGAAGAATGVASQLGDDIANRRLSSPQRYAARAIGGGLGGAVSPYLTPVRGAAVAGAMTPAAAALLEGRAPTLEEMSNGAVGEAALGRLGAGLGASRSKALSRDQKKRLGEGLAVFDTLLRFERPVQVQKRVKLANSTPTKGYLVADHITNTGRIAEAKFGYGADLTKNQRKALKELSNFNIVHFTPTDIAGMAGLAAANLGAPFITSGLGSYDPFGQTGASQIPPRP